jgi:hypothetical protein
MKKTLPIFLISIVLLGAVFTLVDFDKSKEIKIQDCSFEPTYFQFNSGDVLSAVKGLETSPNFKGYKITDYGGCN